MIAGMTTKIAITLPDEQVVAAKTAVADGRAASVSAYISEALARRSADEQLLEMLIEMDVEQGKPSAEDYERAEQALGIR
jgi:antitoxin ParD1/3/4